MNGLKIIRKAFGITIEDLAKKLGVSRKTISMWENNKKEIPEEYRVELSRIFGVDEALFSQLTDEQIKDIETNGITSMHIIEDEDVFWDFEEDQISEQTPLCERDSRYFVTGISAEEHKSPKERYEDANVHKKEILSKVEEAIDYYNIPDKLMDKVVAINRGCAAFDSVFQLMEQMPKCKAGLRMAYYWEIHHVLTALLLANNIISEEEVKNIPVQHYNENTPYDGTEFILMLSELIRQHRTDVFDSLS